MAAVNYVEPEELLEEFRKSRQRKEEHPTEGADYWITRKLARLYMRMIKHILEQNNWSGYGSNYMMELESQALFEFSRYALNFPDNPPHNIFSYYTNMINFAFKRALKKEKTQEKAVKRMLAELELTMIAEPIHYIFEEESDDEVY